MFLVTFLLAQKSNPPAGGAPESDYTPDSGWYLDLAYVLCTASCGL